MKPLISLSCCTDQSASDGLSNGFSKLQKLNTIKSLIKLLKEVPKHDCTVLLGDFNEQLPANVPNRTGKWAFGNKSENSEDLLEVMQMFDLFAANTKFQPKQKVSTATSHLYGMCGRHFCTKVGSDGR